MFLPASASLRLRKHWIGFIARATGSVTIDDGACLAVLRRTSLLPSGVVGVSGEFRKGDTVSVCDVLGREVARGIAEYSAEELSRIMGRRTPEFEALLGRRSSGEAIRQVNLAVTVDHP